MKITSVILRDKHGHKQCIIGFDNTKFFVKSLKQDIFDCMNPKSFKFSTQDGLTLLGRGWVAPIDQPKGIVYLVHSLGEHSGRYDHVGNQLALAGYHLIGFDLRGHGLSEGRRGYSPGLANLLEDIRALIDESQNHLGDRLPKFIYGQGFGGNLAIHFGLQSSSKFQGFIITSPHLSTNILDNYSKLSITKILAKYFPRLRVDIGISPEALSRNLAIVQAFRNDVYVHDKISARLKLELIKSAQSALENAYRWDAPLLLMHGSADRISAYPASEKFACQATGQVDYVRWEGYYHELHHDLGHEAVIEKITSWLNQQTG